jgi:hypothetical protein
MANHIAVMGRAVTLYSENGENRSDVYLLCRGTIVVEATGVGFTTSPENLEAFAAALKGLAEKARKLAGHEPRGTGHDDG